MRGGVTHDQTLPSDSVMRISTCCTLLTNLAEQFYFMDSDEDTEPRKFFCFDGCLVNLKGKELEIQTAELMGGSVPRATYKFLADGQSFSSYLDIRIQKMLLTQISESQAPIFYMTVLLCMCAQILGFSFFSQRPPLD